MIRFKLIKLVNGTWVDPSNVVAVAAIKGLSDPNLGLPHRVEIISDHDLSITCESFEEALELRDSIAESINRARL